MNNYLRENICSLAKLRKSNERFFDAFTDGYSNIYSAVMHLAENENCELTKILGYTQVSLAEQNDITPVFR